MREKIEPSARRKTTTTSAAMTAVVKFILITACSAAVVVVVAGETDIIAVSAGDERAASVGETAPGYLASKALRFSEHPQSSVAVAGDAVFLRCRTSGHPEDPRIRWLHENRLLPEDREGGLLTLRLSEEPATMSEQLGEYRCVAYAGSGVAVVSLPAKVEAATVGHMPARASRVNVVEAFIGNVAFIECPVPDGSVPQPLVAFFKDGISLTLSKNGRFQLLNGNLLFIRDVAAEDAGEYACSATNHLTGESVRQAGFTELRPLEPRQHEKLRLTYRPKEKYQVGDFYDRFMDPQNKFIFASFFSFSFAPQVTIGEDLSVVCGASGNPSPNITWSKLGGDDLRLPSRDGVLRISDAKADDTGSYMCAIFNEERRYLRGADVAALTPARLGKGPIAPAETVEEGASVALTCQAAGNPEPTVSWFFNGLPVVTTGEKETLANGTLVIQAVDAKRDQGIYQCYASNGIADAGAIARVPLVVAGDHNDLVENGDDDDDWHEGDPASLDHLPALPPSRPKIEQSGRHSALLTWTVAERDKEGREVMPIQFFKVQFREFYRDSGGPRRSEWRTLEDVISPRSRSFEGLGLRDDVRYRFRVVAVYANDDNMHGPLSPRFRLDRDLDSDRAPRRPPVVTEALPLGRRSLRVGWKMTGAVSPAVVEGYFVYIRAKDEEDWLKVTIIGYASHSYVFENLEPDTQYEVRVEAFNFAGRSPASRPMDGVTLAAEATTVKTFDVTTTTNIRKAEEAEATENVLLYVAASVVLAVLLLATVLCCSAVSCARRARARKAAAVGEKYADTAKVISLTSRRGDGLNSRWPPPPPLDSSSPDASQSVAETSFLQYDSATSTLPAANSAAPLRGSLSSLTGGGVVNRDSGCSLSLNPSPSSGAVVRPDSSADSLGYEEYTDEPSRVSWKRRRRSEDFS